jgi:hypothetical protein
VNLGIVGPAASSTLQCGIEAKDQGMRVNWLAEEANRAAGLRALPYPLFGEGGNENDRHSPMASREHALKFQSAHPWHLNVHDKAGSVVQPGRSQKFLCGREREGRKAERSHKTAHCCADRFIVVDNRYQ